MKEPRPLVEAQARVTILIRELSPFCDRIEPAGSVRRMKPMVGDLELVAIPTWVKEGGLFGDRDTNLLWSYLQGPADVRWLKGNHEQGRYYQLMTDDGWQVDLFLATIENWGLIHLIRTGSADFSTSILTRWKRLQGIPPEQQGSVDGHLVYRDGTVAPTPEEDDVFRLVKLSYMDPRTRTEAVR